LLCCSSCCSCWGHRHCSKYCIVVQFRHAFSIALHCIALHCIAALLGKYYIIMYYVLLYIQKYFEFRLISTEFGLRAMHSEIFRVSTNFDQIWITCCSQPCPVALPASLARQPCPAAFPGSLARQPCTAAFPGRLPRQPCPAALPASLARQPCRKVCKPFYGRRPACMQYCIFLLGRQFSLSFPRN
jgi:hypothetical protein